MAKRLMCIVLSVLMIMTVLPTGVVGAPEATLPSSGNLTESYYLTSGDLTLDGSLNVPYGYDVTIDLCGYDITYNASSGQAINVYGTLTIMNTGGSGGSINVSGGVIAVSATGGTLTISDGVTINASDGSKAVQACYGGVANINGGTIVSKTANTYAIIAGWDAESGTVNISGGYIENTVDNCVVDVGDQGTLSVSGGYFAGSSLDTVMADISEYVVSGYKLTTVSDVSGHNYSTYVSIVSGYIPTLYGRSLSLGGKIGVNYYFDCTNVESPTGYYVVFSVGSDNSYDQTVYLTQSSNGYYIATCRIYFYQMTEDITATLYDSSGNFVRAYSGYSIYSYFSAAYTKDSSSNLTNMVMGMLCYGTYGKVWAGKSLNTFENSALSELSSVVSSFKSALLSSSGTYGAYSTVNQADDISISPTLVLSDTCELKFEITGYDADNYTVYLDNVQVTPTYSDGKYYVKVSNILVQNWGVTHTIKVVSNSDDSTYDEISNYSVMSYAYSMVFAASGQSEDYTDGDNTPNLRNLLYGMYTYYYFVQTYISD
ncbi:MAG: hypothetical protein LUE20_06100 [Oscillospiraceae bacterium]|nr:hypothetical protein [Oscillospiraceae bacterium]